MCSAPEAAPGQAARLLVPVFKCGATENISKQKCTKPPPVECVLWISKCMNLYICLILQIDLWQQLCAYYEQRTPVGLSLLARLTTIRSSSSSSNNNGAVLGGRSIGQTNSSISSQITSATSGTLYWFSGCSSSSSGGGVGGGSSMQQFKIMCKRTTTN